MSIAWHDFSLDSLAQADPIQIVWQPIVDLQSESILGYEALARFGTIRPDIAFQQAHDAGFSDALDQVCWALALADPPKHGLIFLNVTPMSVRHGQWPAAPNALQSRIVLELPEAGGWRPEHVPTHLTVALDDVGAGFAEMVRLEQVPWRFVKADLHVVQHVDTHLGQQAVIRALVRLAHEHDGFVIAEGVESDRDAVWLKDAGVTYGQGYFWGRPQPLPVDTGPAPTIPPHPP